MRVKGFQVRVSGMVQGVGYRYYCLNVARAYGLTGYVMNLHDGDVEIEVFGKAAAVDKFIKEITRTDRTFRVTNCSVEEIADSGQKKDFSVRYY